MTGPTALWRSLSLGCSRGEVPSNPSLAGWYAARGGAYDASRGGYQANVVVTARWVRTT